MGIIALYTGYIALVIAFIAVISHQTIKSLFVVGYLSAWQGMELLLTYFGWPDFPFYVMFGVFIDWAAVIVLTSMACRNRVLLYLCLAGMVTGAATIVEGNHSASTVFYTSYGYIQAALALLMAVEAMSGDRGGYRNIFHFGVHNNSARRNLSRNHG